MASVKNINDADALLVFRVGPVWCCAPTISVEAVIMPPALHKPPGSDRNHPGVFRHSNGMVSVVDLRQRFGVDESAWQSPGRMVVTEIEGGHAGFLVDEILDVMQSPHQGWGALPALVPREVFKRTLLLNNHIHLYADFEGLFKFRESGYLRAHIATLLAKQQSAAAESASHEMPVTPAQNVAASSVTQINLPEETPPVFTPELASVPPVRINPIKQRQLSPVRTKTPESALKTSATALPPRDIPQRNSTVQSPAITAPAPPTPATVANTETPAFEMKETRHASPGGSNNRAAGKWIVAGLIAALLLAVILIQLRNNKPDITMVEEASQPTTPTEPMAAVAEAEPVQDYQAKITQDDEGIVITIDAPPEVLQQPPPLNEQAHEKTLAKDTTVPPLPVAEEKTIVHVVVKGDTLWAIASRYVRDPWRYPELAKLSNIKNPHRIYPGNKVKIIMRTAGKTEPVESQNKSK